MPYGDLFVAAIQHYGVLLIGLYRLRDATLSADENPSAKRYVVTNPPDDLTLLRTDKVGLYIDYCNAIFLTIFRRAISRIELSGVYCNSAAESRIYEIGCHSWFSIYDVHAACEFESMRVDFFTVSQCFARSSR